MAGMTTEGWGAGKDGRFGGGTGWYLKELEETETISKVLHLT
jgi:hypothetical protein